MPNGINFSGLGSGIDFSLIADAIITQRSRPINQMQSQQADMRRKVDALKQLNAKLITFTESARALTDRALGTGRVANSSNTGVVAATSTDAAAIGTININVSRLASAFVQASQSFTSASDPLLAGGATTATFELRRDGANTGTSITIDANNNSLAGLRDAINAANAGVTATIVDISGNGTQNQLVLTSTDPGASGRVQLVETSNTGTEAALNLRSLNPPGPNPDFSLLDAALTINGLAITRSTNTISNAISGVRLDLKDEGASTVAVSANTTAIADKLTAFVDAYNAVQDFISSQYTTDTSGKPTGVLAGDSTLRTVQQQLRGAVGAISTTNGGAFSNLTDLGIGRDSAGKLTLNRATLDNKLKDSPSDVRALLSGLTVNNSGLANSILTTSGNLSDNISGVVQISINGYTSSINNLDKNIAAQQDRIEALRVTLTRQFAAVDAAIGQLNGQGTALTNIFKSLQPRER